MIAVPLVCELRLGAALQDLEKQVAAGRDLVGDRVRHLHLWPPAAGAKAGRGLQRIHEGARAEAHIVERNAHRAADVGTVQPRVDRPADGRTANRNRAWCVARRASVRHDHALLEHWRLHQLVPMGAHRGDVGPLLGVGRLDGQGVAALGAPLQDDRWRGLELQYFGFDGRDVLALRIELGG